MNRCLWDEGITPTPYPQLDHNLEVDCAIIGAGIAGVTTAYHLSSKGLTVALFDAGEVCSGTSGRNTGKVTCQHDVIYSKIDNHYGINAAGLYYHANLEALEFIKTLSASIDCSFETITTTLYADRQGDEIKLEREVGLYTSLGIPCEQPLQAEVTCLAALGMLNQGRFHPKRYVTGLAALAVQNGCQIFTHTRIKHLVDAETAILTAEGGFTIRAKHVAVCTHFPLYERGKLFFARLSPQRSYIIAAQSPKRIANAYHNLSNPTRSVSAWSGSTALIAGENHRVGQGNVDTYDQLRAFGLANFQLQPETHRWSAQDYNTPDGLPYIGRLIKKQPNIYVATGFNKWGNTLGTAAGKLISDLILGLESPYVEIFSPSRIDDLMTLRFLTENLNTAAHFIGGKLQASPHHLELEIGETAEMNVGGRPYGVYRDDADKLHAIRITCPHMGCRLVYNPLEHSWDCPCHGSRFDQNGGIIDGPAKVPLSAYGPGLDLDKKR